MGPIQSSINNLVSVGSKAYLGGKAVKALKAEEALKAKQAEEFANSPEGQALAESEVWQEEHNKKIAELKSAYPDTEFKDEDIDTVYELHTQGKLDEKGGYIDPTQSHTTPGEMDAAAAESASRNAVKQSGLKQAQKNKFNYRKMIKKYGGRK